MAKLTGNKPISFIQGDYHPYRFKLINNSIVGNIERVVFTCNRLGIEQEMTYTFDSDLNRIYLYEFLPINTVTYPQIRTSYDITIHFAGDKPLSQTGIPLTVINKDNKEGVVNG